MLDQFNRKINYLRISITDRCNLHCRYCLPPEKVELLPHNDILSFEEIVQITNIATELGINKVRLTGGEPLVKRDIVKLVAMLSGIDEIKDLCMTTNGILLEKFARPLAQAGLDRVNVSLDTMDPIKYTQITGGGDIKKVFKGIEKAKNAGLNPIKLNCVIQKESSNSEGTKAIAIYAKENDLQIRYIHEMNIFKGRFSQVKGGRGGNCNQCNRLRVTSNGMIKPCLFSDLEYDIRKLGVHAALTMALLNKPLSGQNGSNGKFYNIGG